MNNLELFREEVKRFKFEKNQLLHRLTTNLSDKSLPLQERWNFFLENLDIIPISKSKVEFSEFQKYNFDYAKYTIADTGDFICFVYMVTNLSRKQKRTLTFQFMNIDNLKEDILSSGYKGYYYIDYK